MLLQQKQYLTHYAPMIIGRWALPIFKTASRLKIPIQYLGLPLSAHPVRSASSTTDMNQEELSHPLTIYTSVTSAIELITGLALRTPAAIQRDKEKLTKLVTGPAQLVLT